MKNHLTPRNNLTTEIDRVARSRGTICVSRRLAPLMLGGSLISCEASPDSDAVFESDEYNEIDEDGATSGDASESEDGFDVSLDLPARDSGAGVAPGSGAISAPGQVVEAPGEYHDVFPMYRSDDMPHKFHYPVISPASGLWHDIKLYRWAGSTEKWKTTWPGGSDPDTESVTLGMPVYAPAAGEPYACWRTMEYGAFQQEPEGTQPLSGNYLTMTPDSNPYRHYVLAHFEENSIPSAICPNGDADGLVNDIDQLTMCPPPYQSTQCSDFPEEVFVGLSERVEVRKGQFIGRAGVTGNADGAHVHVGAGDISYFQHSSGSYEQGNGGSQIHWYVPENTWYKSFVPSSSTSPASSAWDWEFASGGSEIPDFWDLSGGHVAIWPGYKHEKTYSGSRRLSDYNGDGHADLLCHNTDRYGDGDILIDYWESGENYEGEDWDYPTDWCKHYSARLHTGDFNGDGKDDLLCHSVLNGNILVDFAQGFGYFSGVTDETYTNNFCTDPTHELYVGDFDGDGEDDLLCHDYADGRRWIDYHSNGFGGADDTPSTLTNFCAGHYGRLHVGDFNESGRDDIACQNLRNGNLHIWNENTDSYYTLNACGGGSQQLFVGEFGGDSRDDFVCYERDTGNTGILYNVASGGTVLANSGSLWCTGPNQRVRIGDENNDGLDDLFCIDDRTGYIWVNRRESGGFDGDSEIHKNHGWCVESQLHAVH